MNDAVKHVLGRLVFFLFTGPARVSGEFWPPYLFGLCPAFLARSGPCSGWVLGLGPQLVSCVPLWVVLAFVWAESSALCRQLVSCHQ